MLNKIALIKRVVLKLAKLDRAYYESLAEQYREDGWSEVEWFNVMAYQNYSKAMSKRRSPLEEDRFINYMLQDSTEQVWEGDSVMLGQDYHGIFCPSHFCPNSMREGTELLKKIKNSDRACVFAVTDDLVGMLEKLGYKKIPNILDIKDESRGYQKTLLTNSIPKLLKIVKDFGLNKLYSKLDSLKANFKSFLFHNFGVKDEMIDEE